MTLLTL